MKTVSSILGSSLNSNKEFAELGHRREGTSAGIQPQISKPIRREERRISVSKRSFLAQCSVSSLHSP